MRRFLTGLLGATLLLGACGDDDDPDRSAITSIPDDPTTSSTATTAPKVPPPDVIPQDVSLITEEYVEQVLDALYEVSLEALVATRTSGAVDQTVIRLVEATSSQASAVNRLNGLAEDAADGFTRYRTDPTPVDAEVVQVIEATKQCVFAEARFDSSGLTSDPGNASEFRVFARLRAASATQLASGLNPTAWVLDGLPATDDGSVPDERCSAADD